MPDYLQSYAYDLADVSWLDAGAPPTPRASPAALGYQIIAGAQIQFSKNDFRLPAD